MKTNSCRSLSAKCLVYQLLIVQSFHGDQLYLDQKIIIFMAAHHSIMRVMIFQPVIYEVVILDFVLVSLGPETESLERLRLDNMWTVHWHVVLVCGNITVMYLYV